MVSSGAAAWCVCSCILQAQLKSTCIIHNTFCIFSIKQCINKIIIEFGFCDIQNNQGLGKCNQPRPPAEALIILDITKTSSNYCLLLLLLLNREQHKAHELDMITRDIKCPWHDYCIICSYDVTGFDQDLQQLWHRRELKNWKPQPQDHLLSKRTNYPV